MCEEDEIIKLCFDLGLSNNEILQCLLGCAGISKSVRTLKRKMKRLGLFRRKNYSELIQAASFISEQQETSGALHGYRWMHMKCIQNGLKIPRDTVYGLMKVLDPIGMDLRLRRRLTRRKYRSRGPNFVWHIDGYDKLKPYGIAIHGCIDGYSRLILWLEAASTNNDPKVVANYFINAVKERGGCPSRVRADLGTENVYIANIQHFLRRNQNDEFSGERSFLPGKSTQNQRIEWFWGLLRKEMAQFYIDLFKNLERDGNDFFCGDMIDKSILQFCFMNIIQVCVHQCFLFKVRRQVAQFYTTFPKNLLLIYLTRPLCKILECSISYIIL